MVVVNDLDIERNVLNSPVIRDPNWLPEGEDKVLDDLRERHRRLLTQWREASAEAGRLRDAFDVEDREYRDAVRAQLTDPEVELPEITSAEERATAFAPIKARGGEIQTELGHLGAQVLAEVTERADEMLAVLDEQDAEARQVMEQARQQMAEAQAQIDGRLRMRRWVNRHAGRQRRMNSTPRLRMIAFERVPVPRPTGKVIVDASEVIPNGA